MTSEMKVKEFRGDSNSLEVTHWVRHLELLATANGWTEQVQMCNACAALTGNACYWLDTVNLTDWQNFKTQIIARFGENPEVVAQRLYNCRQRKSEAVAQYTDRFRQLSSKLNALKCFNSRCLIAAVLLARHASCSQKQNCY